MTREQIKSICPQASEDTIRKTLAYHAKTNPDIHPVRPLETRQPEPSKRCRTQNPVVQKCEGGLEVRIVFIGLSSRPMDRANFAHSLKSLQDEVCAELGIDDHDEGTGLSFEYHQIQSRTPAGVFVHVTIYD